MSPRSRKGAWALAGVLAGLGLVWLWPRAPEVGPVRPVALAVSERRATPEPPRPEARREQVLAREGLWLRARLQGERPFMGEARVGLTAISEADRGEWEEARREGWGGAGPTRLEDLANVVEWRTAPVTPTPSGGGTLGPVEVSAAPRYRLLAWEADGTFYWGDFVPEGAPRAGELDAGVLRATRPTGLRVRLTGGSALRAPGRYLLSVERVVEPAEAERASELLPVVRHLSPSLASALQDETPLPLVPEEELLLRPLPPDRAVRLRVRTGTGRESEPVEVPLREGHVEAVVLELGRLFPEGEGSRVELRGRLLLGSTEQPPPAVRIERVDPPGGPVEPGPEGRFVIPGLPAWRASRFAALVEPPAWGRPVAPTRWEFEFTPDPRGGVAEETWRVPAHRWLVLRMDAFTRRQLEGRARRSYPVFLLQRRDAEGSWRLQPAEEFRAEEDGMAISLLQPGTYRVLAAASPQEIHESPAVELAPGDMERSVTLGLGEEGVPCEVRVHSLATGRPVYGALVTVAGEYGSLPPVRGRTDGEGRWQLGRVNAPALHVNVQSSEGANAWAREPVPDCRRSGIIELRL